MSHTKIPREYIEEIELWVDFEKRKSAFLARENQLEAISLIICDDCRKKLRETKTK